MGQDHVFVAWLEDWDGTGMLWFAQAEHPRTFRKETPKLIL